MARVRARHSTGCSTHADPGSLLDVGCGEGVLRAQVGATTRRTAGRRDRPGTRRRSRPAGWERHAPNLEYSPERAEHLPFADGEFDLAPRSRCWSTSPTPPTPSPRWRAAPRATCSSRSRGSRCGGRSIWRAAPTGGARQHTRRTSTTSRGARSCALARHGRSSRSRSPFPGRCCLSASARRTLPDRARRRERSYGGGARAPLDRDRLHRAAHLRLLRDRLPPARRRSNPAPRRPVVGDVRRHLGDLPPRSNSCSRARSPSVARAAWPPHPMRVPLTIQGSFALVFLAVALPLHHSSPTACSTLHRALLGLRRRDRSPTPAPTSPAAGSPATSTSRLYGGARVHGVDLADRFALAVAVGLTHGQSAIALGIAAAPFVSLVVVPADVRAARRRREAEGTYAAARPTRAAPRRSPSTGRRGARRARAPRESRRPPT